MVFITNKCSSSFVLLRRQTTVIVLQWGSWSLSCITWTMCRCRRRSVTAPAAPWETTGPSSGTPSETPASLWQILMKVRVFVYTCVLTHLEQLGWLPLGVKWTLSSSQKNPHTIHAPAAEQLLPDSLLPAALLSDSRLPPDHTLATHQSRQPGLEFYPCPGPDRVLQDHIEPRLRQKPAVWHMVRLCDDCLSHWCVCS